MAISTPLEPTASNFRAELARHRLRKEDVASIANMHPTAFSNYLVEQRTMTQQAAERIASAINASVGYPLFSTELMNP